MRYRGREIDPVGLWSNYCDFPAKLSDDDHYLPKVVCPNPNHDSMKRHFQVNAAEPLVHCFAQCGISGTYEHAICMLEGLYEKFKVDEPLDDRRENKKRKERAHHAAKKIILQHAVARGTRNGARRRIRSVEAITPNAINTVSDLAFSSFIPPTGIDYLTKRGITSDSIALWELGWRDDELRIAIPAHDYDGFLRFLIRRAIRPKDQPKYLYTEGFPKTSLLFGACKVDPSQLRSLGLILTEGSLDTIKLHQHGLRTATAILGTGISDAQRAIISRLRPRRIYFMFDKDMAGVTNIEIAGRKLRKYPLFVCRYPRGISDPAELSRREAERVISRALPIHRWMRESYPNVNRAKELSLG